MLTITAIYYDDIYFAEVAQAVLEFVAEYDEETHALSITCWACGIEAELSPN